ncbi:hypothetical protein PR202_ga31430 [Eleusine coracana subsp. coracana]|uniref:DUF632 domain-containing protein n=1 Tax=Eleusine coracana subsp. coracana TaxID=191504 RepID=A0AAV5DRU8_ELECO|nr:hypothetical protein PR202_ga31430 [Eleusine coracana subsp. coracana]
MDSVGSSPVTPPPPLRMNPTPPTPPPPVPESQMATWDYFFGPTPTPPPTLEQAADETWMERHEKEPVAEVRPPVTKPVIREPVASEEKPPQTAAEKEKAIEEMVANLPLSKPIVRKPPKPPGPPPAVHYHTSSMGTVETRKGKLVASGTASLLHIVSQLDDHFLRASESAHDVSKKLEATRMHYHSNHADSRGKCHIDHSTKIMHVITWNRSFKNLPDHDDLSDNFEIDERCGWLCVPAGGSRCLCVAFNGPLLMGRDGLASAFSGGCTCIPTGGDLYRDLRAVVVAKSRQTSTGSVSTVLPLLTARPPVAGGPVA